MKKKRITGIVLLTLIAAGLTAAGAHAASPRRVTVTGIPFKWNNSQPIVYDLDLGPFSPLSKTQAGAVDTAAEQMVKTAFQQWSSISTAKLSFMEGDPLDRDVTGANLADFLNGLPSGVNPVIFDADGSVIDALLGGGSSLSVLSFSPFPLPPLGMSDSTKGILQQAMLVLNGRAMDGQFDPDDLTPDDLTRVAVRGIGQFLGVGASDTNDDLIFDGNEANHSAVPIMHPLTQQGMVIGGGFAPTLDDQMAVSALYPSATFNTSTGEIKGQLFLPDGTTGAQGFDVIARKVDDPVNTAVSAITGVTFRVAAGTGAADPSLRGAYDIHVPPGSYTLEFRPLYQAIGPLVTSTPLPGGSQYYQAPSGTPAPSAAPAAATPITVNAGQTTTINFTAVGKAAPAPQAVAQVKPDDAPANAQLLPAAATVTGTVSPKDPGQIVLNLGLDPSGSGKILQDKIENLYRIVVPEPSIVTLYLQPKTALDLKLYLLADIAGGSDGITTDSLDYTVASAVHSDTSAIALQVELNPGVYLIGVSARDDQTKGADYSLSVTTTSTSVPAPQQAVPDQLVVGNITDTGAQVSWITDMSTTADAIVGMPDQQVGDPMPATAHRLPITGLTASSDADLTAYSQVPGGARGQLPRVFFHTADKTAATGPASLQAFVLGTLVDTIGTGDAAQTTVLVALAIRNAGAPASNVQITALTASAGWKLAQPLSQPLMIGGIGSNGTATVVVRLLPTGTDTTPLATVTGTGTLAGAGATITPFTVNGP